MNISNQQIADIFNELADLIEIEGESYYRARAYRNAARLIEEIPLSMALMVTEHKDLTVFPGIGQAIAGKIKKIVMTGQLPQLLKEEKKLPAVLSDLTRVPGLGPRKIKAMYDAYQFQTLHELRSLLSSGHIAALRGFSEKSSAAILKSLDRISVSPKRLYLIKAEIIVKRLLDYLEKDANIFQAEAAGSYRRRQETVGDIDIVAAARNPSAAIDYFVNYPEVSKIIARGTTRASLVLWTGIQVDFRVVGKADYGAALYHFTGSKAHNIALRALAIKKDLKINEYGIFRHEKRLAGKTETELLRQLDLPYIEPELRENTGEIVSALENRLPHLIQLEDIRGDLHCHTNSTDGKYPLEAMVAAAHKKGYEYLAITDHSQRLAMVNGLDKARLKKQIELIEHLNAQLTQFTILKSIEVDILEDGSLDLPDDILKELDLTVCSIHSKFNLSSDKQTERIIRAMDNPYFNILGHATGRLLNHREPYQLDMEKIIQAAADRHCILEINAQPSRLDINDNYARLAKSKGVKLAISSDAHSIKQLNLLRFGVFQARRGWIEAKDVINTRSLKELRKLLVR